MKKASTEKVYGSPNLTKTAAGNCGGFPYLFFDFQFLFFALNKSFYVRNMAKEDN